MLRRKLTLSIGLIAIFAVSFSVSYLAYGYFFEPVRKPTTVTLSTSDNVKELMIYQDTSITKIEKYKCGNEIKENIKNIPWIGKSLNSLKNLYSTSEGWDTELKNNKLILSKYYDKLCPYHSKKHFGIYKGKLAIFEGPLGNNVKVLEVESNVDFNNLPLDYQEKLRESMKITDVHENISKTLRDELEFANDMELEEALQNLDEYMEY